MGEYEKQKLLSEIVDKIVNLVPKTVQEVRCSDGEMRTRPLIDIADAVEIVNSFRGEFVG